MAPTKTDIDNDDNDNHRPTSPTPSHDDTETNETLPLYQDLELGTSSTGGGPLQTPDPRATPDEVRDFLVRLLIQTRGLHLDQARRVASNWTRGTGRELCTYPPLLFTEIFGYEEGWMVYKESRFFIGKVKEGKFWPKYGGYIIIGCMLSLEIAAIAVASAGSAEQAYRVIAGFLAAINGLFIIVGSLVSFFSPSLEDRIEDELRAGLRQRNGA